MKRLHLISAMLLLVVMVGAPAPIFGETFSPFYQSPYAWPENNYAPVRAINENVMNTVQGLAAEAARQKKKSPPPPLNSQALLHGTNALALSVLDAKTLRPVTEYTVHAELLIDEVTAGLADAPTGAPQVKTPRVVAVGRLESQQVKDAGGRCRYLGLGWATVRLSIWATGYLPRIEVVRVPEDGPGLIVKLDAAGALKGRVVDAASGAPLGGVQVTINCTPQDGPPQSSRSQTQTRYFVQSNDEGRFCITPLPPGRCRPILNEYPSSLSDFNQAAISKARQGGEGEEAFRAAYQREVARPRHVMPRLEPVELKSGATLDLGTIRLERAPTLELEMTYEGQAPLGNFPFEIIYLNGLDLTPPNGWEGNPGVWPVLNTNDDGKARLTLAGWQPGQLVAVVALSLKSAGECSLQKLGSRLAGLQSSLSVRDWFRLLAGSMSLSIDRKDVSDPAALNQLETLEDHESVMVFADPGNPNDNSPVVKWISEAQQRLLEYDDLAPEAKARFQARLEDLKSSFRSRIAANSSKPDHPNYEIVAPRAGEVSRVRLDFRPTTATVDLMLRFVDRQTSQPVARFRGIIGEKSQMDGLMDRLGFGAQLEDVWGTRSFHSMDGSGLAVVPALVLPPDFLTVEKELEKKRRESSANSMIEDLEDMASLNLAVDAPGYMCQSFKVTLTQLRAGGELTFALEPAASVRGRVVLAATGRPLTSSTLVAALKLWGRQDKAVVGEWRPNIFHPAVDFANPTLAQARALEGGKANTQVKVKIRAEIGPDGVFKIDGLQPHEDWQCLISLGLLPDYRREKIALQPGLNDLGEIRLGMPGWLAGKFVDEQGRGIEGVMLEFPAEPIKRHDRETTQTRTGGGYRVDLLPFKNDRQLVRIVPPWGDDAETTTAPKMKVNAVYEKMMTLDRCGSNTLSGLLHRGNPLVLRLPPSARLAELERFYSVQANCPVMGMAALDNNPDHKASRPYFAIRRIALQGLEAGPEGLTYAETRDVPREGLKLTSGTIEVRLDGVPPGRYAVSVEGALLDAARPKDPAIEIEKDFWETIPLAFAEFTMPPTSATLALAPAAADVELTLDGVPPGLAPSQILPGPFIFLEREGALSTLHGNVIRRITAWRVWEAQNRQADHDPEKYPSFPMLGYFAHFMNPSAAGWRPALLRAVPPGRYRLQAYSSPEVLMKWKGLPYFEDRVEVTSQTHRLRLAIPWQAPEK